MLVYSFRIILYELHTKRLENFFFYNFLYSLHIYTLQKTVRVVDPPPPNDVLLQYLECMCKYRVEQLHICLFVEVFSKYCTIPLLGLLYDFHLLLVIVQHSNASGRQYTPALR